MNDLRLISEPTSKGAESLFSIKSVSDLHTHARGTAILNNFLGEGSPVMVEYCIPSSLEAEAGGLLGAQGEPEQNIEHQATV